MYRFFLILLLFAFVSCATSKVELEKKISPKLLAVISDIEDSGMDEFVNIVVTCKVELSYEMRKEVGYTGAKIDLYSKNVFHSLATTEQIRKISQLSFVKYIKAQ